MGLRINKYIAQSGLASRRKAEELVSRGKILVNGQVIKELGTIIEPGKDKVEYIDEAGVRKQLTIIKKFEYLILNKPRDVIVSKKDEFNRKTVYDILPERFSHLNYVGRLDYDSEGLVLFTNNGELANRMSHPSYHLRKTYIVKVSDKLSLSDMSRFSSGIKLDGKMTRKCSIKPVRISSSEVIYKIVLQEGRKRQIRLMFEYFSLKVLSLKRVAFGPLSVRELGPGKYKQLNKAEINLLRKSVDIN